MKNNNKLDLRHCDFESFLSKKKKKKKRNRKKDGKEKEKEMFLKKGDKRVVF